MELFRMEGNKVQLYRYKVTYEGIGFVEEAPEEFDPMRTFGPDEVHPPGGMKAVPQEYEEYCISEEQRDEFIQSLPTGTKYTVEEIDQSENEWIEGKTYEDTDTARAALMAGR